MLRDPLTNEPLSSSNNSSQKSERVNHELGATTSGAEIFGKITLSTSRADGDERGASEKLIADEKRKRWKSRDFLEQLEEIGRWTVTRAVNGGRVLVALVFPLDLYSEGNPVWAAAGKNGRRGDGEEFNGGLLRALFGFGKNARGDEERKRMEMINEADQVNQEHGGMACDFAETIRIESGGI